MALGKWLAVHPRGGAKLAVRVDDIIGIQDVSESFLKLAVIQFKLDDDLIVFGTVEEIVDKING